MGFFSFIYSWLVDLYGTDLDAFLLSTEQGMNYVIMGVVMLIISLVIGILYYKIIDKPKWAHWYSWTIAICINSILNLWWGWQPLLQNLWDGKMDVLNEETGKMECYITETQCFMFGIANVVISIIAFIVISLICRRWSTNCKYSPLCK
jgi:hypothetical protein